MLQEDYEPFKNPGACDWCHTLDVAICVRECAASEDGEGGHRYFPGSTVTDMLDSSRHVTSHFQTDESVGFLLFGLVNRLAVSAAGFNPCLQ